MAISLDEVRRIAALAHLDLDEATALKLRADLAQILSYVEKLNELDVSGVAPALGVTEEAEASRKDIASASLDPEEVVANAPDAGQGYFKVPRVLPG